MILRLLSYVALAVLAVELVVTFAWPSLLRWLARIPVAVTRTFSLPSRVVPVEDATYRQSAARVEHALPPLPPRLGGLPDVLLARPDGTFVLRQAFPWMTFVARIVAERDGEQVTLRAAYVPLPLSFVLIGPVALVLALQRVMSGGGSPMMLGLLVGLPIAFVSNLYRAHRDSRTSVEAAMERIEEEAIAAATLR